MTIETFIEKSIEGGWNPHNDYTRHIWNEKTKSWWYEWDYVNEDGEDDVLSNPCCHEDPLYFTDVVLDPEAWKAIGKVEKWDKMPKGIIAQPANREITDAEMNMHNMVTALWEGKTIQEYISTL